MADNNPIKEAAKEWESATRQQNVHRPTVDDLNKLQAAMQNVDAEMSVLGQTKGSAQLRTPTPVEDATMQSYLDANYKTTVMIYDTVDHMSHELFGVSAEALVDPSSPYQQEVGGRFAYQKDLIRHETRMKTCIGAFLAKLKEEFGI